MQVMRGKNLGPMENHPPGIPLGGGGGLIEGAAVDPEHGHEQDESDRLIEDDDVRLAIRRIAGVELLHEGAVELLPRASSSRTTSKKRAAEDEQGGKEDGEQGTRNSKRT